MEAGACVEDLVDLCDLLGEEIEGNGGVVFGGVFYGDFDAGAEEARLEVFVYFLGGADDCKHVSVDFSGGFIREEGLDLGQLLGVAE